MIRLIWLVVILIILATQDSKSAQSATWEKVLSCKGNTCKVNAWEGGTIGDFVEAYLYIKRTHKRLVIDRPCYSACVVLADLARSSVCIKSGARFYQHSALFLDKTSQGNMKRVRTARITFAPPHSSDIAAHFRTKGKYSLRRFKKMDESFARTIWRSC
ncbi:MAG TPA: hypothetical protein VD928_03000 [Candidatus Paceibacterota bacterium]|nr:hypothetical protein [Candidatus Paceibacterota bacterium]